LYDKGVLLSMKPAEGGLLDERNIDREALNAMIT
jgi:hypothetical protein